MLPILLDDIERKVISIYGNGLSRILAKTQAQR